MEWNGWPHSVTLIHSAVGWCTTCELLRIKGTQICVIKWNTAKVNGTKGRRGLASITDIVHHQPLLQQVWTQCLIAWKVNLAFLSLCLPLSNLASSINWPKLGLLYLDESQLLLSSPTHFAQAQEALHQHFRLMNQNKCMNDAFQTLTYWSNLPCSLYNVFIQGTKFAENACLRWGQGH